MKTKDIKVGHIYYVDFEPTRKNEFDKKHLAVVLKKNADKITFVVIQLTSKDSGVNVNKVSLGYLECLPERLRTNETFAVYDQVRTLNSSRFEVICDQNRIVDVIMPEDKLKLLYKLIIKDILYNYPDEKSKFLEEIAYECKIEKA